MMVNVPNVAPTSVEIQFATAAITMDESRLLEDGRAWTSNLLTKAGELDVPVNLEKVAQAAGVAHILYENMLDVDGLNRPGRNGRVIVLNSKCSAIRQRFTLAHEIAHMFFVD